MRSAEVLRCYMDAWKNKDIDTMLSYCQKTWVKSHRYPRQLLKSFYDIKTLDDYEIDEIIEDKVISRITCLIIYKDAKNESKAKLITAVLVKESGPYKTSAIGDWGVNPISCLKEEDR